MRKTLRCAVVGLGRIAWEFHLPQICKQDGFELAAVVDPSRERREEACREFRAPKAFATLDELLAVETPDLAVIASPSLFHTEQTIAALRHGCDVFCDKPLALNLKDARAMFAAARGCGRKLMSYQQHRISSEAETIRSIIDSGKLGRIYLFEHHVSNYVRRNDWQAYLRNGGGMLLNYGSHYIDQLLYLLNDTAADVKSELLRIASAGDAEDVVRALITTSRGTLLDININQAAALPLPEWRICGTRGAALYSSASGQDWRLRYYLPDDLPPISADTGLAAANRRYPRENIPWHDETLSPVPADRNAYYRHCYDYFALGKPPLVKPPETLELIRVLEECRRTASAATPKPERESACARQIA